MLTLSAKFFLATWQTFIQTGVLYDVTLVCCDPFTETHGVVVVAADQWSDIARRVRKSPVGLMELLYMRW